jgi:hypothetical protein
MFLISTVSSEICSAARRASLAARNKTLRHASTHVGAFRSRGFGFAAVASFAEFFARLAMQALHIRLLGASATRMNAA